MKLNARIVDSIKPTAKRAEYRDDDTPGLILRVTDSGAKSWCVLYRHRGRLRRYTIGSTAVVGLAQARQRARDALLRVSDGADIAAEKQEARRAETVGELADEYLDRHAKRLKRSWREDRRILRADVLPKWKHRAIADITRGDVRDLLDGIVDRGSPVQANRTLALVRKLWNFAIDRDLVQVNPASRMQRPGREQSRERLLAQEEIRTFWRECDGLAPPMAAFFRLRLVTAQRGIEVANARWEDIDLESGWWTIPATTSKNAATHRVPLTVMAKQILATLQPDPEKRTGLALAGARGRRQQTEAASTFSLVNFKGHDLRRTASTLMAERGVNRFDIACVLNHRSVTKSAVTAVYDRYDRQREKLAALNSLQAALLAILDNATAGKVLAFAG